MLGRLLDVFTFLTSLHNAWQLSSALKDTLMSVIDQGVQLVGIKDEEGNAIDTQKLIGDTIENWLASLMGERELNAVKEQWARYNRIINTGANVINSIQGITDGIGSVVELGAQYTGKIGNALLKSKVVLDDSYQFMSEKISAATGHRKRLQNIIRGIETSQEVLDNVEGVLSSANSIVYEVQSLNENLQEFNKQVSDELAEKKEENDNENALSSSPEITKADLES